MNMFFSVILPIYNVEKYLSECVESILNQDFDDYELILVDDGSTDGSPQICDDYSRKDHRVKVIHKSNGGLSDARNVGTNEASGKYIVYVDSDDYISDSSFLTKLYTKAGTDCDIIVYKFKKYFEKSKEFGICGYSFPRLGEYVTIADKVKYLVSQDAFYCSAWSKAVRRELLVNNGIQFEKGLLGEDQEWYYHVLLNAESMDGVDEDFVVYRQRENSITSSTKIKNLTDCIYVLKKWKNKIETEVQDKAYQEALLHSLGKLLCNLMIAYSRFKDPEKKKYYHEMKDMHGLLNYHENPRTKKFYMVYRVFGFDLLMKGLELVGKVK